MKRREFIQFLGGTSLAASQMGMRSSCSQFKTLKKLPFVPVSPSKEDQLVLADGFNYEVMISWGEKINSAGEKFGFNNDYTALLPFKGKSDEAILWVNHEYPDPTFCSTRADRAKSTIDKERKEVGGSLLKVKKDSKTGNWNIDRESPYNRRLDMNTKIPFDSGVKIEGTNTAIGTGGNCAGGVTPWNTFLTCEEVYVMFYGDRDRVTRKFKREKLRWDLHYDHPPEHYGWVVEVEPLTGKAKKLTGLGRFFHECATTVALSDGRAVCYMGDDTENQCLYKFIASKPGSLEEGELFVADTDAGKWISLDRNKQEILKKTFKNQLEVSIYTREAAKLVGGSPQNRPEDIEINPRNNDVFFTLTNNKLKNNWHGSLLKISPKNGNHESEQFSSKTFLVGGESAGFSSPDNICFDPKGNLWLASDVSGSKLGKGPYAAFPNNGLYYIPMAGPLMGNVYQVASAPVNAEFTGISFTPDGKRMIVSVQHPGEKSKSLKDLKSHWPEGGSSIPRPAVVQISGPSLEKLLS